jgi:uncharacterized protein
MDDVKLNLDANGRGEFYISNEDKEKAKMMIDITGDDLTAFHTKVLPEYEGKGLAKKLVDTMVDYARKNHLKVTHFVLMFMPVFPVTPKLMMTYGKIKRSNVCIKKKKYLL